MAISGYYIGKPEYFLMTSKEGIGVVVELKQGRERISGGRRRASRIVPVEIPVISFVNPTDGRTYQFDAQGYRYQFPGTPGDSAYIHYKIKNGVAEGVISYAPGESTFFSRNKPYLIWLGLGLVLMGVGYRGRKNSWN